MNPSPVRQVAFVFHADDRGWHGGKNYFNSLFMALGTLPPNMVQATAFIGAKAKLTDFGFPPSVHIVQDGVFDRKSVKWALNKMLEKALGRPLLSNSVIKRHGADVLSHSAPSGDRKLPSACWIADFQHLHLPQFFQPGELRSRDQLYRHYLKNSDLAIVSSESARRDLERFAPAHADKVRVLRFCATPPDVDVAKKADLPGHYQSDKPYFYLPGQMWAHKNHLTAIRALADLRKTYPDVRIVCSGGEKDYRNPAHLDALKSEIRLCGLEDHFIILGIIPYTHIVPLMLKAVAVINPSLFEGWSTIVEEAKAIGAPLVLSDLEVHREQCQHGEATFFKATDAGELAAQMKRRLDAPRQTEDVHRRALETYLQRIAEFARSYESLTAELCARAAS